MDVTACVLQSKSRILEPGLTIVTHPQLRRIIPCFVSHSFFVKYHSSMVLGYMSPLLLQPDDKRSCIAINTLNEMINVSPFVIVLLYFVVLDFAI